MSYNGSGTFNINTAGQPVVTGTVISSSVFNALTADLATGLSTAITKDGQTTVTNNIPLNGYKITNLGAGTASTDAVRLGQLQAGTATAITVSGTDTYTGTMSPALASYTAGNTFSFVVPNTNTTGCTLNIDGQGAKAITRDGSTALIAGDLVAGSEVVVIYDGTRFQVLNSNSKTNWTVSSALTLSGGTANGVAYLNGSKALTTGSALTFDGTILGVGSGSTSGYGVLQVRGGFAYVNEDGANTHQLYLRSLYGTAGPAIQVGGTDPLLFVINSAEQMRLTSTGLGIGTSSPAYKLDVVGVNGIVANFKATGQSGVNIVSGGAFNPYMNWYSSGTTLEASIFAVAGSGAFAIGTGSSGTERMRIDSSGNLGLGVTPSAWGRGKAFEVGSIGNSLWGDTGPNGIVNVTANAYLSTSNISTGWKYAYTDVAARYTIVGNSHQWFTAPSGTAGTAISFTQAMTLDASGRLLVGVTSGSYALDVGDVSGGNMFRFTRSGAELSGFISGGVPFIGSTTNNAVALMTNGTERARIDSSGNLLVGTTSAVDSALFQVVNSGNQSALFQCGNNSANNIRSWMNTASGTRYHIAFADGTTYTERGSISTNGVITAYNTTSDYRLKNVIGNVTGSGARIDALEPVEYEWKSNGERTRGFLAHKFQEVYPQSVTGTKDAVDADGNPVYQAMQASTSEVIADLVAELQSLRARVAQLESK